MHLPPYGVLCRSVLNRDMRSSFFHKLETVLSKRKLTKSGGWNVFVYKRKTDVELSSRMKNCKIFDSRCAKCLTCILLYENTALKSFCLSCTVSTLDAYYIADTKSLTGARYNSVLTCSLLVTNLYHISQLRTFSSRR